MSHDAPASPGASAVGPAAEPSVEPEEAATVLRELAWVIHRSAPERAGGPIPTTEVALLKQVIDSPGSTVGELAASLGLRQPNASSALRSLERRGFVQRIKGDGDQRVTRLVSTPQGVAEHAEISDSWKEPLLGVFDELDPAERDALTAAVPVLHRIHGTLLGRL